MFFTADVQTMAEDQVLISASFYKLSIIGFHQEFFAFLLFLLLFHQDSSGGVLFIRIHQEEFFLSGFIRRSSFHQDSSGFLFFSPPPPLNPFSSGGVLFIRIHQEEFFAFLLLHHFHLTLFRWVKKLRFIPFPFFLSPPPPFS